MRTNFYPRITEMTLLINAPATIKQPARRTDLTAKPDENQYLGQIAIINDESEEIYSQVIIGERPHGGEHVADLLLGGEVYFAKPEHKRLTSSHKGGIIGSLKYQKANGTAESKIAQEALDLQYAVETYGYKKAIIVMAGQDKDIKAGVKTGWTTRKEWLNPESFYRKKLAIICPDVEFMDEETFKETYRIK